MHEYPCLLVIEVGWAGECQGHWARSITLPFVPYPGLVIDGVNAYDTFEAKAVVWHHDRGAFVLTEEYRWNFPRNHDFASAFGPDWAPYASDVEGEEPDSDFDQEPGSGTGS